MKTSRLVERVIESNRQATDARDRWAPHRSHVMAVLQRVQPNMRRWCILGAGHLHDVALSELIGRGREREREISLVDVDEGTVTAALTRADARTKQACRIVSATDLTGVLELLDHVTAGTVDANRVMAAIAAHVTEVPGAPFDVTVSLGVLTQLLQASVDAGFPQDEVPRLALALRDKHLRDLVRLTRPGGMCVLITDVVSSATAPQLLHTAERDLEHEMARVIAARNFFTGANPYRIVAVLEDDEMFRGDVCHVQLCDPWLWAVTPDRHHLTVAILATRTPR